jgi:hypothetical protein
VIAVGPPGLTIQLWVSDGSAGRAWYQRLFGRPPDFTPFGDDTFCEWIFKPGYWEIHVVEKDSPGPRQAPLRFGVEDIRAARDQVFALASRLTTSKNCRAWCGGATSLTRGATG